MQRSLQWLHRKGNQGGKRKKKQELQIALEKIKTKFSFPVFFILDDINNVSLR